MRVRVSPQLCQAFLTWAEPFGAGPDLGCVLGPQPEVVAVCAHPVARVDGRARRTADPVQEGSQESPQTGGRGPSTPVPPGGRPRKNRASRGRSAPDKKCRKQRPGSPHPGGRCPPQPGLALSAPGIRRRTPSAVWDKGRPGCGWGLGPRLSGRSKSRAEHSPKSGLQHTGVDASWSGSSSRHSQDVLRPVCQMLPPDRMAASCLGGRGGLWGPETPGTPRARCPGVGASAPCPPTGWLPGPRPHSLGEPGRPGSPPWAPGSGRPAPAPPTAHRVSCRRLPTAPGGVPPASGSPAGCAECPRPGLPPVAGLPRATHKTAEGPGRAQKASAWWHCCSRNANRSCVRGLSLRPLQIKKQPGRPGSCPSAASGVARPGVLALGLGGGGCLLFGGCFPGPRART